MAEKTEMEKSKYRLLLADDEVYVRDLLVKNIQESDVPVEVVAVAGDGKEALEAAKVWKPNIIITDIAMPFINGLELIKELQKIGISSKNIIISGYDEFEYAKQAISLGVTDYLLKPFLPRELIEVLKKSTEELDNQKILNQKYEFVKRTGKESCQFGKRTFFKRSVGKWNKRKFGYFRKSERAGIEFKSKLLYCWNSEISGGMGI